MTSGPLRGVDLAPLVWQSPSLLVAVTDAAGVVVDANPALVRRLGRNPSGEPAEAIVGPGQAAAFAAWLTTLGEAWNARAWAVGGGADAVPQDFSLAACRTSGHGLVLVGEPLPTDDVAGALLDLNDALVSEHRRLDRERDRLSRIAEQDGLTGVANRRAFEARLAQEVALAGADRTFSIVMLDIDHFEDVNDRHGHPAGDAVLRWLARLLRGASRRTDFVARYGGEEFVAILADASALDAASWADRLRLAAGREPQGGLDVPVTLSAGVASWGPGDTGGDVVARADRALNAAKAGGRDRVVVDSPPGA